MVNIPRLAGVGLLALCTSIPATFLVSNQDATSGGERGVGGSHTKHARVNMAEEARKGPPPGSSSRKLPKEPSRPIRFFQKAPKDNAPPSQRATAKAPSPPVGTSFLGLGDDNRRIPPDTAGAVGTTHIMTMLNTQVRFRNRSLNTETTMTLDGFWASVLGSSQNAFAFDPRILFDPYYEANGTQGRWIAAAVANAESATSAILLGASETSDPTGVWNLYILDADATNQLWADFPSVGFNRNWIVVQVNMFPTSGSVYGGSDIYAFDKADVIGGVAATHTKFDDEDGFTQAPAVTYDETVDSISLVEDWSGQALDDEQPFQKMYWGTLRIRRITKDATTGDPVLNPEVFARTTNTWEDFSDQQGFGAPQLGSSQKLDTGDARIQGCVYRNASLWCAHTIFLPAAGATRSAVQWWQLNDSDPTQVQQLGRIDSGASTGWYAYPSIAVNNANDALIGFTRFTTTSYASAGYAFRAAGDSPNSFRDPLLYKGGEAPYFKTFGAGQPNRWGDYSSTTVDPVNDADLWTLQEYAETPVSGIDRWGTMWARAGPAALTPPSTLSDIVKLHFVGLVTNVTPSNFVLRLTGGAAVPASTPTCFGASGAVVGCVVGPVKSATIKPSAPLIPGQKYEIALNPAGAPTSILDNANNPLPTFAVPFRGSTSQEESSVAASPRWRSSSSPSAHGGSYLVERLAGSRIDFRFTVATSTTVSWYSLLGPAQGLASVYRDGALLGTFNNYRSSNLWRYRRTFSVAPGNHSLSIIVKGVKGSSSGTDTQVVADAFQVGGTNFVSPALCTTNAFNNCIIQWWRTGPVAGASGGRLAFANLAGDNMYFKFRGTRIDFYTVKGPTYGKVTILIDGVNKGTFDLYRSSVQYGFRLGFSLPDGLHEIRIAVTGTRNAASTGTFVAVDRWVVS